MTCPGCGSPDLETETTRRKADRVERVRACRGCGRRFGTRELVTRPRLPPARPRKCHR